MRRRSRCSAPCRALGPAVVEDRVDQGDVAEGLREVAHEALGLHIILLRDQTDIVADADQPLDQRTRLLAAVQADEVVGIPERAGQERALVAGQPVRGLVLGVVAQHEAVPHQGAADRVDGADYARIILRQEAHMGDQQQARVEALRAVGLHEAVQLRIEPLGADLGVDLVADLAPARHRHVAGPGRPVVHAGEADRVLLLALRLLEGADGTVEGDPGHDLRMHEVPAPAAHLPDALVGGAPHLLEVAQQRLADPPAIGVALQAALARLVERVEDLAVDVELELLHRRVADAHGLRVLVAGQPVELDLGQHALPGDAVEDVRLLRVAGDRAHEPVAPGAGLVDVAAVHERDEGEGRIAQPAEPVVPVAHAAEILRQGGGGRRHDAAGGMVDQRLQGEERALQDRVPGRARGRPA